MLLRDRVSGVVGALFEHFGFLPEDGCVSHGSLPLRSKLGVSRAD
jgi:hypothetical protein